MAVCAVADNVEQIKIAHATAICRSMRMCISRHHILVDSALRVRPRATFLTDYPMTERDGPCRGSIEIPGPMQGGPRDPRAVEIAL